MMKTRTSCAALTFAAMTALLVAPAPDAAGGDGATLLDAVTKGSFTLDLRYRFEDVDQEGFDQRGKASTLRTAAGYRTGIWKGLDGYLEFEDVRNLGYADDHDNAGAGSLWNGVDDLPVVADPPVTQINQAYLGWRPIEALPFRLGLQEINIDNQRFVGNVGWRQNHQSFEAARVEFTGVDHLTLAFSYIGRQHNVVGGSQPMDTMHLGAAYVFEAIGTVKLYGMVLDYDDQALSVLNTTTLGAFFDGSAALSDGLTLSYRVEAARQIDTNNPVDIDASYLLADVGLRVSKLTFGLGWEVLSGSAADGQFRTPLATLHKFNGWADKFLATPTDGLRDLYGSVTAVLGRFKLIGVYHDFSADTGGGRWGTEVDAAVIFTAPWKQRFAIKLADYSADELATDTTKLWLWTSWGF